MVLFDSPLTEGRLPLSRERILRAALSLCDEHGIAALSMRKLARSLDVEAMSLYNYVSNKDDLLDGMVDAVNREIDLPVGEWKAALREYSLSARRAYSRHRWAIALMQSRVASGPATLTKNDAVIATLRWAGFSLAMTAHGFSLLDSYVSGFAQQEAALPFEGAEIPPEIIETFLKGLRPDLYPHLSEFARGHVLLPGYDYGEEFLWGLDLILDGLARALPTG